MNEASRRPFANAKNHRLVTLSGNAYGTPWTEVRLDTPATAIEPDLNPRRRSHNRDMSHEHVAGTDSQEKVIGRTFQEN